MTTSSMIRTLGALATAWCSATMAQDESVQLPPLGSAFAGTFNLGGRAIPLPEGQFVVTARGVDDSRLLGGDLSKPRAKLARALLVQTEGQKLRAAVCVSVALKPPSYRFDWVSQPCRKQDTLFRADLSSSMGTDGEDCLLVDHRVANFTAKSQGMFKETTDWLSQEKIQVPVPVLIVATVTRMEGWQLVTASYAFNPEVFGCDTRRYRPWADSPWHRQRISDDVHKVRFVESVTAWGKVVQTQFKQLFIGGQPSVDRTVSVYQCAGAAPAAAARF
jgi:hypothetical protein